MKPLAIIYIYLLLPAFLVAGVSSNPFLRPGSSKQPPPPPKSVPPPPVKITNAEKEVEFRGYFILNGEPFFCIFNKKSGHAEWLAVSESTFESYLIKDFDLESEKLTLSFEGQSFSLSLMDSKASGNAGKPSQVSRSTNATPSGSPPARQVTRFMPPRPKTTPTLPDWLSKKRELSKQTTLRPFPGSYPGSVPRRTPSGPFFPGLPTLGNGVTSTIPSSADSLQPNFVEKGPSSRSTDPQKTISAEESYSTVQSVATVSPVNATETSVINEESISLENLPPPPPPPNILPPSPPPDIQPSRDE
jgi:hypothetical protein